MILPIYRNIAEGRICISVAEYLALDPINVTQRLFWRVAPRATFFHDARLVRQTWRKTITYFNLTYQLWHLPQISLL